MKSSPRDLRSIEETKLQFAELKERMRADLEKSIEKLKSSL